MGMAHTATKTPRRDSGKRGGEKSARRGISSPAPSKYKRRETVNRKSWLAFLDQMIVDLDNGSTTCQSFQGQPLHDKHLRALHRWRKEGSTPTIWTVDDFLCTYGSTLTDFEIWCSADSKPLWQYEPPDWWDE